ncbi:MAG: small-conductance mechanosensitive channel [Paraglaciecola sp.]
MFAAIAIWLLAKLLTWFINSVLLGRIYKRQEIEIGRQFAFNALIRYVIYTIAALFVLQTFGVKYSVLWGDAAALLVGIGLGLQQTFTDLLAGLILLLEGTVSVGDIVNVDGTIGKVIQIGIRTTNVETRDGVSILMPNSKLVMENATNWSHKNIPLRFQVNVGVAYTSDVKLVTDLLLQAAGEHKSIRKKPAPEVLFQDFGDSSLDFSLYFFSKEFIRIEHVKSEIGVRVMLEQKVPLRNPQITPIPTIHQSSQGI